MDVVSNLFALLIEASWVQLVLFFRMLDSVCSSRVSLLAEWGARIWLRSRVGGLAGVWRLSNWLLFSECQVGVVRDSWAGPVEVDMNVGLLSAWVIRESWQASRILGAFGSCLCILQWQSDFFSELLCLREDGLSAQFESRLQAPLSQDRACLLSLRPWIGISLPVRWCKACCLNRSLRQRLLGFTLLLLHDKHGEKAQSTDSLSGLLRSRHSELNWLAGFSRLAVECPCW